MKHLRYLLVFLLLLSVVLSGCTTATGQPRSGLDIFRSVITFQFLQDLGISQAPVNPLEGFVRFLLLILLFTLLTWLGSLALPRNVAAIIAGVISLMTVIFIPSTIILATAVSYSMLFITIIFGTPLFLAGAIFFFVRRLHWLRAILLFVLWFVVSEGEKYIAANRFGVVPAAVGGVASSLAGVYDTVIKWMGTVSTIIFILFVIAVLVALFSRAAGTEHQPTALRSFFRRMFREGRDAVAEQVPETFQRGADLRHQRREVTRALNTLVTEREELTNLRKAMTDLHHYVGDVNHTVTMNAVESRNFVTQMDDHFKAVGDDMGALDKVEHKWASRQRKENQEINRLLQELRRMRVSDDNLANIEAQHTRILDLYSRVERRVKDAQRRFAALKKLEDSVNKMFKKVYKTPGANALNPQATPPATARELATIQTLSGELGRDLAAAEIEENNAVNATAALIQNLQQAWRLPTEE